jgi:hypothetical protein
MNYYFSTLISLIVSKKKSQFWRDPFPWRELYYSIKGKQKERNK